jgi:flavodoxin
MKTLVAYFSASGVTSGVASKLNSLVGGDLFEIVPEEKYSSEDLDWTNNESRTTKEMKDRDFRPEIVKKVDNISDYEKVVIGFPIWWYTAPTIINTFIEENDLANKDIYVFITSGGSGVEEGMDDLEKKYPDLRFIRGMRFTGREEDDEYINFLK